MEQPLPALPSITTQRLYVRPLALSDVEAFQTMTDEPGILDAIHFLPRPFQLADAERLITGDGDGRDCFWGIWQHGAPALLGTVGTHLRGSGEIEIGYWFSSAGRGQGLALEAVTNLASSLVRTYPERRIYAECRPQNSSSWRLLEKVGFHADGTDGTRTGRKRLVLISA
ncbi:MAG: GNAT family N-acetyltransferase [Janthinobacterium lividum]